MAVHRDGDHLGTAGFELVDLIVEADDLRRADKREVHRIEEEDDIAPPIVGQADFLELASDDSRSGEVGGRLLDL